MSSGPASHGNPFFLIFFLSCIHMCNQTTSSNALNHHVRGHRNGALTGGLAGQQQVLMHDVDAKQHQITAYQT